MLEKKPETIREMFGKIAPHYDFANDFLSMGWHRWWRKQALSWSGLQEGYWVLDAATGTGDMAFLFQKKVGEKGRVFACDFCEPMLEGARQKQNQSQTQKQNQKQKQEQKQIPIEFLLSDVTKLPFKDKTFDFCNISFGIRNVQEPVTALKEMARVTKEKGFVFVMEFGHSTWPFLKQIYGLYQKKLLPYLGHLLTGHAKAYRYLESSASQFPCGEDFLKLMESTQCFSSIEVKPLNGGMVYLYRAQVGVRAPSLLIK